jgi:hypothetical protein
LYTHAGWQICYVVARMPLLHNSLGLTAVHGWYAIYHK